VVSFTSQPLYPWGKSFQYPLDGRLDGPQGRSGRRAKETNLLPLAPCPSLYRLSYCSSSNSGNNTTNNNSSGSSISGGAGSGSDNNNISWDSSVKLVHVGWRTESNTRQGLTFSLHDYIKHGSWRIQLPT
jgi:hypothetical protein